MHVISHARHLACTSSLMLVISHARYLWQPIHIVSTNLSTWYKARNTCMQHLYATPVCNTCMQHLYATPLCNTLMSTPAQHLVYYALSSASPSHAPSHSRTFSVKRYVPVSVSLPSSSLYSFLYAEEALDAGGGALASPVYSLIVHSHV